MTHYVKVYSNPEFSNRSDEGIKRIENSVNRRSANKNLKGGKKDREWKNHRRLSK